MGPSDLNDLYDQIADRFSLIQRTLPKDTASLINAELVAWQDWFYGNYDIWPREQISLWIERYELLHDAIERLAQQHGTRTTVYQGKPKSTTPTVLPEHLVVGTRPWWYIPLWGGAILLALMTLSKASKT